MFAPTGQADYNIDVRLNQAPVAVNDTYTFNEDTSFSLNPPGVKINDSDPDGNPLTASLVTTTTNGTLFFNADGSFLYTPNSNFYGTDSFTYRDLDGLTFSNTATVTLNILNVQDAPTAVNDTKTVAEDSGATAIDVLANDFDVDNQPASNAGLTVTAVGAASHGSTAFTSRRHHTPAANYYGPDSFTYHHRSDRPHRLRYRQCHGHQRRGCARRRQRQQDAE